MVLGKFIKQPGGFKAFIPADFPSKELLDFSPEVLAKAAMAERLTGKLDGITQTLPDADFFLSMYIAKDATFSSQIEGTRATLMDALELDAGVQIKETDADDILFYIGALNYGMKRLKKFPLSLRFVRELHKELMTGARSSQFAKALYFLHIRFTQHIYFSGNINAFFCCFNNTIQKKMKPGFCFAVMVIVKPVIIQLPVLFKISRKKQYRFFQYSPFK